MSFFENLKKNAYELFGIIEFEDEDEEEESLEAPAEKTLPAFLHETKDSFSSCRAAAMRLTA